MKLSAYLTLVITLIPIIITIAIKLRDNKSNKFLNLSYNKIFEILNL